MLAMSSKHEGNNNLLKHAYHKCTVHPEIFIKARSSGNEVHGRLRARGRFACLFYIVRCFLLAECVEWPFFSAPMIMSESVPFKA